MCHTELYVGVVVNVCVYMFSEYKHTCMGVHVHIRIGGQRRGYTKCHFPPLSTLCIELGSLTGTQSLPFWLDQLASLLQGSPVSTFHVLELQEVVCLPGIYMGTEDANSSFTLSSLWHGKCLTYGAIAPAPHTGLLMQQMTTWNSSKTLGLGVCLLVAKS